MPLTSHGGDIVSRAPGKLYIAGEYAVVEPGHPAILVAVDRFVTVSAIREASEEQLTAAPRENLSLTRDELARGAQASTSLIDDLVTFGLIRADSGGHFDADALAVATAAAGLAEFGVQARHLRPFRLAADREVGLVEQVPLRDTTQRVTIAQRALALHIALVKAGLRH